MKDLSSINVATMSYIAIRTNSEQHSSLAIVQTFSICVHKILYHSSNCQGCVLGNLPKCYFTPVTAVND